MDRVPILLVDDEPRNLDALEAILGDPAYRLLRAVDGDGALRILLEQDVAAIILDIQLPGMSGLELAQLIKRTKRFREIPIIFLTAHLLDERDVISGYGVGAVDYVTKPFNPQILRHKVAVFAELFRKTRALAELNETLEARVKARTAELERSEAALRESARQKDEFLAVLAHELRNPLAPIRTGVDLLLRMVQPQAPLVVRTLRSMNRQISHVVRLIDDLLDVSRISHGMLELKNEHAELDVVVQTAVETIREAFEQKRVTLLLRTTRPIHAVVDPTRIAQIVGNLLHNALKYTSEGCIVTIEVAREGEQAVVRVKDDGIGIPSDQLGQLFEMFVRIERRTPVAGSGAGIGLALAKRLAKMHGGDLTAYSAGEGLGTTFTLTIPALATHRSSAASAAASTPPTTDARPLDIVIIEDNEDAADTLTMWLEALGHRVQVARDGTSGVELVFSARPEVVLCDLGLPDIDGVEVCARIRERRAELQPLMVAMTGWGRDEDRRRTAEVGFDHHLVKPVAPEILGDLLRQIGLVRDASAM
jgi:signal transduction histidine kinase